MKVLVINTAVPFVRGGAEELADQLVAHLNATPGVAAELVRLPFKWTPSERLIEEILVARNIRLHNVDRVIGLKFPAYLVPHDHKSLWLLHQFRQAYDLAEVGQGLGDEGRDATLKQAIRLADDRAFHDCRAIFANSPVTQARLKRFNGFDAEVLYPPVNDEHLFTGGEPGGYVFAGGRVGEGKRQHLLIEAFARGRPDVRLVVAGPPDDEAYANRLRALVDQADLKGLVQLEFGFHSRERIASWVNGALACAYIPYDEDSLGYVTMEAFAAGKPVVTTTDSGGLLEIVSEETGAVADPDPASLAETLAELLDDRSGLAAKGRAARDLWIKREITWAKTIDRLLA